MSKEEANFKEANFGEWHPVIQHIEHQVDSMTWCKGYAKFKEDPIILKLNEVLLELEEIGEMKQSIIEELEKHLYGLKEYNERKPRAKFTYSIGKVKVKKSGEERSE